MLKDKTDEIKHATHATLLLRCRLGRVPEATPQDDPDIHALERCLSGLGLQLADLITRP